MISFADIATAIANAGSAIDMYATSWYYMNVEKPLIDRQAARDALAS